MTLPRNSRALRTISLIFILAFFCPFVYGKTIYVDHEATGVGNGLSWADACRCLQNALADADSGDEIRVAEGIYKPDRRLGAGRSARIEASGDRTATFQLKNGVTIKGGYAGSGQPDPDARDIGLYKTILSGDLGGDDGPDFANNAENSRHVVTASRTEATAVLDGFTITGGNADDAGGYGGGMLSHLSASTVTNCTFSRNRATRGGGMANRGDMDRPSGPTLTNCVFRGNRARWGGAMCDWTNSSSRLMNCIFSGNTAEDGAATTITKSSDSTLTNCTFIGNRATDGFAGGIDCTGDCSVTLVNTILWNNRPTEIRLGDSSASVAHSDVLGGWSGRGNINADPIFADAHGADGIIGTEDDDLRLLPNSPCIDAGDDSAIPRSVTVDLDGNPRIMNDAVDMGAYEATPTLNIYHVDATSGDDNNDGLTAQAAFATIQNAVATAVNGEVVLVYPGLYEGELDFQGKTLTVQGMAANGAGVPVLQNPGDFAVSFCSGEGPDSIMKNFIIRDSFMGVFIAGSSPTISNLTIVGNKYGIEAYAGSEPEISDTILWNNTDSDLFGCEARYCCVERGGEGDITVDPLFVDLDNGDYRLRSERGRYWAEHDVWVLDEVTSPCIDAGDPNAKVLDEPMPNGGRINIGAYGGTPQASLSPEQLSRLPCPASCPSPADGSAGVATDVILSWTACSNTVSHDIYFGFSRDMYIGIDIDALLSSVGNQTTTRFDPGMLYEGTTYFWRVDEINSTGKTTGQVWTFSTRPSSSPGPVPPKGRACFTDDTGVWLDGVLVPISTVDAGEPLRPGIAREPTDSPLILPCPGKVENVQEHTGTFVCYDVLLESGNSISVAECHYFLTECGQWVAVQDLKAQMRLRTSQGSIGIRSLNRRPKPYVGRAYNLRIEGSDWYLVGEDAVVVRDY